MANWLLLLLIWALTAYGRCPNWCNQRGICTNPMDGDQYCICNEGFKGEDCSQRFCPKAFEPHSLPDLPNRRTLRLLTSVSRGALMGRLEVKFGRSSAFLDADGNGVTNATCTKALRGWKGVSELTCVQEYLEQSGAASYLITLQQFPLQPFENNLFSHDGNPPISHFSCNTSDVDLEEGEGPQCFFEDVVVENLPLYAECSDHGSCNKVTGKCECEKGYHGDACDDTTDNEDIFLYDHDGPFFTATVLKLSAQRTPSSAFNVFQTTVDGKNVTSLRGDGLFSHRGNLSVAGRLAVGVADDAIDQLDGSQEDVPSMILSSVRFPMVANHFHATTDNHVVSSVDMFGNFYCLGALSAGNGSFHADHLMTSMSNAKVLGSLDVTGSAHFGDSVTIGSGFALTSAGMTVDVSAHSGTLFELTSREKDFRGSLFEMHASGAESSLIKTVVDGLTTFELSSGGQLTTHGVRMKSGGMEIEAGGMNIGAGGLSVHGGVTVESGGLHLQGQVFEAAQFTAVTDDSNLAAPLLRAQASNPSYTGAMVELVSSANDFTFLRGSNAAQETMIEIFGDGSVITAGGLAVGGEIGAVISGNSVLEGGLNLHSQRLAAGANINIAVSTPRGGAAAAFVTILDDGMKARNELHLPGKEDGVLAGQVAIISNQDEHTTRGAFEIPANSTVVLLFDGQKWVDVQALRAPMTELKNVRVFEASSDLDVGNVSFSVGRLRASRLTRGSVLFAGNGGAIREQAEGLFTYVNQRSSTRGGNTVQGMLSAPALRVGVIASDVDMEGNVLRNPVIENGKFSGLTATFSDLTLRNHQGMAFFDEAGRLIGHRDVTLDASGHLVIRELHGDVNGHQNRIFNATIESSVFRDIPEISAQRLFVGALAEHSSGLAITGPRGELLSSNCAHVTAEEGQDVLHVDRLAVRKVTGDVELANAKLLGPHIVGGDIDKASTIHTNSLIVDSLGGSGEGKHQVVLTDTAGRLIKAGSEELVSIKKLGVNVLEVTESLDLHGKVLRNAKLDPVTVSIDHLPSLSVGSISIDSLKAAGAEGRGLIGVDLQSGTIASLPSNVLVTSVDDTTTLKMPQLETDRVITGGLKLTKLIDGGEKKISNFVLSLDDSNAVVSSNKLRLDSLVINSELSIPQGKLRLLLPAPISPTLLAINEKGAVGTAADMAFSAESPLNLPAFTKAEILMAQSLRVSGSSHFEDVTLGSGNADTPSAALLVRHGNTGKISPLLDASLLPKATVDSSTPTGVLAAVGGSGQVKIVSDLNVHSITSSVHSVEDTLTTNKLRLRSLSRNAAAAGTSLLSVDKNGEIVNVVNIDVPQLKANEIEATGTVAASKLRLTNLDPSVAQAGGLLSIRRGSTTGEIELTRTVTVDKLQANEVVVDGAVSATALKLPRLERSSGKSSLLHLDADGSVSVADAETLVGSIVDRLPSKKQVSYTSLDAANIMANEIVLRRAPSSESSSGQLVLLDEDGKMSSSGRIEMRVGKSSGQYVLATENAQFGSLGPFAASGKLRIRDAALTGATVSATSVEIVGAEPTSVVGDLIIRSHNGELIPSSALAVEKSGTLKVDSIAPHSEKFVSIQSGKFLNAAIVGGSMSDATMISSQRLEVKGPVNIEGKVDIGGNLMVDGTVMGSGPYMDHCDARFKKNIVPLSGALEKLKQLDAVTYENRVDEFNITGAFNARRQIGWVADRVEPIVPEIVETDANGYKAVAYGRATALVGEAVKELEESTNARLAEMQAEIARLQDQLNALLTKTSRCKCADDEE